MYQKLETLLGAGILALALVGPLIAPTQPWAAITSQNSVQQTNRV